MTINRMQHSHEQLAAARQELLALLHSLTPDQWHTRLFDTEHEWNVATVITHLVEAERGMSIQVHKIRKGEVTVPEGFDLNRWNAGVTARMGERTPVELLELLGAIREKTLAVMATLHDEEWVLTGRHPSRGVITIAQYYETMAGHDRQHAQDIRNALQPGRVINHAAVMRDKGAQTMKTIRWGIIGCGDVTEVKSGPGFQKATNSALVAVMRRNSELAADYARRHGVPQWYDDAEALITDPNVDVVYIATPPNAHKEYTLLAAQAGKPVYVEKPMALNHVECQDMIATCELAGVSLFVAYYRRCLPRFVKIKELIDGGAIGTVRTATIHFYRKMRPHDPNDLPWRVNPEIAGGGLFVDLAAHTLDYLDYFLGPIQAASGYANNQAGQYPTEDVVVGSFVFATGAHGVGVWSFASSQELDQTEIIGDEGKLTFASFAETPVLLSNGEGVQQFQIDHPPHVQQPLIQTIVDELNGIGECPSTGVSGARTSWVMDQLLAGWRARL